MKIIDLTHPLRPGTPEWPTQKNSFQPEILHSVAVDGFYSRRLVTLEHYGTHIDAPAHFVQGGWQLHQIPVERFFAPAYVISIENQVRRDNDYRLSADDVLHFEAEFGPIAAGSVVLLHTGWDKRWPEASYLNMTNGLMHFPGFGAEAAQVLIGRGVYGIGIDTLSIDRGTSEKFEVHNLVLAKNIYQLENVTNLALLPPTGARLIVAPMYLEAGSGAPCRIFATLAV